MNAPVVVGSASAKVICDSVYRGSRLVSIEVEFPRPYLAEFNTHRVFSRNSASSRAIPVWKRLEHVLDRPYVPNSFGANKAGMQAGTDLSQVDRERTVKNWLAGRDVAVIQAYHLIGGRAVVERDTAKLSDAGKVRVAGLCDRVEALTKEYGLGSVFSALDQGLHKQHANRVLEPYTFHTVIVTSTYWRNYFGLRGSKNAQPEAQDFGLVCAKAMMGSVPTELQAGEWHLPYIRAEDRAEENDELVLARASAGKCARTSYLTHDGVRSLDKDVDLANDLHKNGHMSPFEHVARPFVSDDPEYSHGNFSEEWTQFRKLISGESDFTQVVSREELLLGCRGDEQIANFILSLEE